MPRVEPGESTLKGPEKEGMAVGEPGVGAVRGVKGVKIPM